MHPTVALEELHAFEMKLLAIGAPHAWPLERNLLPGEHHVTLLTSPSPRLPALLVLVTLASELLDLLVDERLHDQEACFSGDSLDGVTDTGDNLRDRQAQLNGHVRRD